jgi:hypothetical protein
MYTCTILINDFVLTHMIQESSTDATHIVCGIVTFAILLSLGSLPQMFLESSDTTLHGFSNLLSRPAFHFTISFLILSEAEFWRHTYTGDLASELS